MPRFATCRPAAQLLAALCLFAAGSSCAKRMDVAWEERGVVEAKVIDEASGLAPSRRGDGMYWVHNDSGNDRLVFAIDERGHLLGTVRPTGLPNQNDMDWEDMSSFELNGRPMLLVADVGDNDAVRPRLLLHVFEEPPAASLSPSRETPVPVLWTLEVSYPNGPRDCESVAVDPLERKVYLLTKREFPQVVYVCPLDPQPGPVTLTAVGRVETVPRPDRWQETLPAPRGRYFGNSTGLDFSADGHWAVILSYGNVVFYRREGNESWGVTLSRTPVRIGGHMVPQAEAVCFERRGLAVRVLGEGENPIFFRGRWTPPAELNAQ